MDNVDNENSSENIDRAFEELSVDMGYEDASVADTIQTAEDGVKKRVTRDVLKRSDNGYHVYYIIKRNTKIKIEMFSTTCNTGGLIRCPYTGYRTNDRVGSAAEKNYFKAKMPSVGNGTIPIILYYPSADAFERHHFITIPQYIKNSWTSKEKTVFDEEPIYATVVK